MLAVEHENIRGFPDWSERVSLLFIIPNRAQLINVWFQSRLLAARTYLTIDVRTSPADNHVPYQSTTFESRCDGRGGGCSFALLSDES
jgi:hypothetical protein